MWRHDTEKWRQSKESMMCWRDPHVRMIQNISLSDPQITPRHPDLAEAGLSESSHSSPRTNGEVEGKTQHRTLTWRHWRDPGQQEACVDDPKKRDAQCWSRAGTIFPSEAPAYSREVAKVARRSARGPGTQSDRGQAQRARLHRRFAVGPSANVPGGHLGSRRALRYRKGKWQMTHSQKRKEARISAGHMRLNHKDLPLAYLPATNKPKSSLKDDRVIQNLTLPLHFFLHIIRT